MIASPPPTGELKNLRQWVCWRFERRDGKLTKVPYSPTARTRARCDEPGTWGAYEEARKAAEEGGYDGIGFVFANQDPYCGIDLDGCRDAETGELEPWAQELIDALDSYTEVSPSGRGVHVLVRAKLPAGRNRNGRFECYDRGRYFTVTGRHLQGTPQTIEHRQEPVEGVLERVFPPESPNGRERPPAAPGAPGVLQDEEIIGKAHAAANGEKFARLWGGDAGDYGSASESDLALCSMLAFWVGPDAARIDSLFRKSGLYREKWDREDYRTRTVSEAIAGKTEFYEPGNSPGGDAAAVGDGDAGGGKPTQAELLIECAGGADLFSTPAGDAYASVVVGGHRETHPIKAKGFRRWLLRGFYERVGRPPGAQAMQDALGLLEARAEFDGPEREVYIRTAEHGGNVYIDLANPSWEIVEITATGWRVVAGKDAPVRFRRPRGMLALPVPVPGDGGCGELLRRFLNVSQDEDLRLIIAWLVAALRPSGPYPVLLVQGEQGSAKSTAARLVRALVDPSAAPLRTTPRSEHDLFIAADNSHVAAFDNISSLQPWLSDALCRLSTGGGFSTRTLYADREEELFEGVRPVILNGITDVATRPDLLDRSLIVSLPAIPDEERKPEKDLWRDFERARPALLASLFDAVSGALGTVNDVRLEGFPRMADFALWATAAESSLGWSEGSFLDAYQGNRDAATDTALEADPVADAVQKLMEDRDEWTGTATELWSELSDQVDEEIRRAKAWPQAPNSLTGRLKRLAPTLRGIGISYDEVRVGKSGRKQKRLTKNTPAKDRQHRQNRQPGDNSSYLSRIEADGPADGVGKADGLTVGADDAPVEDRQPEFPIDMPNPGAADGADDDLRPYSDTPDEEPVGADEDDELPYEVDEDGNAVF